MAFVVEDGTGKAESNAYYSTEQVRAYAFDRNLDELLALEDKQLEGNIINASSYLDSYFCWNGDKRKEEQGLEFPRIGIKTKKKIFSNTSIPSCFLHAIVYLSLPKVSQKLLSPPEAVAGQRIKRALYQIDGNTTKDITYAAPGELIDDEPMPYLKKVIWRWLYQDDSSFLGTVIVTGIPSRCCLW